MLTLNLTSRVPLYEQIYSGIVRLISAGVLKPGDRIPTVRALSAEYGINPNTVARAYKQLEAEGYIISRVGRGSFVADDGSAVRALRETARKKLLDAAAEAKSAGLTQEYSISTVKEAYYAGNKERN